MCLEPMSKGLDDVDAYYENGDSLKPSSLESRTTTTQDLAGMSKGVRWDFGSSQMAPAAALEKVVCLDGLAVGAADTEEAVSAIPVSTCFACQVFGMPAQL